MIKLIKIKKKKLSKWVTLVEKTLKIDNKIKVWHYFKSFDYLSIFTITDKKRIAIVNTFFIFGSSICLNMDHLLAPSISAA